MSITYVGHANHHALTGDTWTCNKPNGIVAGDLMLAVFFMGEAAAKGIVGPAGWIPLAHDEYGTTGWRLFAKTAGGGEPASYTFSAGRETQGALSILAWRSTLGRALVVTDIRYAGITDNLIMFPACTMTGSGGALTLVAAIQGSALLSETDETTLRIQTAANPVSRMVATHVWATGQTTYTQVSTFVSGSHPTAYLSILVEESPVRALFRVNGVDLPLPAGVEVGHAPVALRNPTLSGHQAYRMLSPAFKDLALTSLKVVWEGLYEEEVVAVRTAWQTCVGRYTLLQLTGLSLPINDGFSDICLVTAMPDEEMSERFAQGYRDDDPSPDALLYDVQATFVSEPLEVL